MVDKACQLSGRGAFFAFIIVGDVALGAASEMIHKKTAFGCSDEATNASDSTQGRVAPCGGYVAEGFGLSEEATHGGVFWGLERIEVRCKMDAIYDAPLPSEVLE